MILLMGLFFMTVAILSRNILRATGANCAAECLKRSPQNSFFFYNDQVKNIPLSELPFPARDIEKLEKHSYINITKSVGCYGKCSFCHINLIHRNFSTRSVQSVVDEMCFLSKKSWAKKCLFSMTALFGSVIKTTV